MLKIDYREKTPKLNTLLIESCEEQGIPYELTTNTVGDYIWEDKGIVIELKRIDDFAKSMMSKHLDSQIIALQQFKYKLLLIYGEVYHMGKPSRSAMARSQFESKILSIEIRDQVPCYHVESSAEAAKAIMDCRRFVEKGMRIEEVQRHPTLPGGTADPSLTLYYGLKGVGLQKAHDLKETYGKFSTFLFEFKKNHDDYSSGLLSKKEFSEKYPASLVNKTTREYLLEL
ncbi:ERCC4 domain-containing protein [Bacteroides sp.]|uniref:ERCC4 domain-containing protein n=1 Tax=Bacteroides sp. TaxID=29523 RepID=UPI00262D949A|nr:ERCC4 domain-containing protein [Bacteroides sp.]MDD3040718.1 ERCC4 domain-containing protein [Bacteroides sp.]